MSPSNQHQHLQRWLGVILLISVILRIGAALYLGGQVQENLPGINDQISYHSLAVSLLAGKGYQFETGWYPFTPPHTPTAHWSFAYPAFLAALYGLLGVDPLAARLVQSILVGILMPWLLYLLGKRLFSPFIGLLAAAWCAIYPYFIYYSASLMTESFFTVGVLAVIYLLFTFVDRPDSRTAFLLGLAIGITALFRQVLLPVAPLLLVWAAWELRRALPWKNLLIIAVTAALCIAPWTIRNYRSFGSFLLLNSNSGYALWAAVHPSQGAYWHANIETVVIPIPQEWTGLNEAQLDRKLTRDALGTILADPRRYFLLTLSKAQEQFKFWPDAGSSLISNLSRALSFGIALPFMIAGLILSRMYWRRLLPVYLFILAYNSVFLLSWPSARYRLATDALMLLFAAYALAWIWKDIQAGRRRPARAG